MPSFSAATASSIRVAVLALLLVAPAVAGAQTATPPPPAAAAPVGVATPAPEGAETLAPAGRAASQAASPDVAPGLPQLSPWSMFLHADDVVKAVMCGLAFASLVTWTVLLAKSAELLGARRSLTAAMARLRSVRTLADARDAVGGRRSVLTAFLAAAALEARLSREANAQSEAGVKERAASLFAEITRSEGRRVRRGMGVLATIGSTAPFVGLFGTVWGIMNSFIGISKSQTTNLAVVAPGIAEALLATASGLVAAIPAVIIYNHFSRQTRGYLDTVAQASGVAGRLLSRDLDSTQGRPFVRAAE